MTPFPFVCQYVRRPKERGEQDGRRDQGDRQDGPEEEDPAIPSPPGRRYDLLRVAPGAGGRLHRREGTEEEAAQGKGGVGMGVIVVVMP